jgi:CRISPR-associated protein Cas1
LLIRESEEYEEVEVPLNLVEAVIAVGPVYLSTPVIRACLRHEAPVHLWTASGDRLGTLDLPGDGPSATIIGAQVDFIRNPEKCLVTAREIVAAKIYNHRHGLRRQIGRGRADDNALADLKELMGEALRQPSLEALRGVEGRAARVYFDRLRAHVPAQFGFSGRSQRPAADPVNALLNLVYSLLYRQISSLLAVERLHPGLGFYHKPSDRYHALAADLQEEFRYWADLLVLRLIHRGQLTAADFVWTEKGGPACRIQPSALRAVILLWRTRLEETLQLTAGGPLVTFRQRIHEQIRHFKSVVLNPDQGPYRAYRSR